ncbi:MAG: glycosyltransferase [Candidatus Kapabacteria bacterium]|nr:glycosyltransferase [Candidatus Kapabacteria bacterium]
MQRPASARPDARVHDQPLHGITEHRGPQGPDVRSSIIIPSWNNLPYLRACVEAIRQHSTFRHEIIVHVNDGGDGTLAWVRAEGLSFTHSADNVGVCHALNAAAALATTPYIVFMNDDMIVLPDWDAQLWAVIDELDHDRWFLSATMIEPRATGNPCVVVADYGDTPERLRRDDLLRDLPRLRRDDWSGATWPPNVVPRSLWEAVGGYSVEFSPGFGSDPDFSMKLWQHGVRLFLGVGSSLAYHFQARSTGRVVRNDGPATFLKKWGVTVGTFNRHFLRRGEAYRGPLTEPSGLHYAFDRLRSSLKRR